MGGYVVNFTVYTMAMIGLICFAVFVYRKITDGSFSSKNGKYLSVEETMSLSPRKTLHVVRAGSEKFLIASDIDRTTLLAKLDDKGFDAVLEVDDTKISAKPEEDVLPEVQDTQQQVAVVAPEVTPVEAEIQEENKDVDKTLKEDKIIAFETIYPPKEGKTPRKGGVKVQRKRTTPKTEVVTDYKKHNLSPIEKIAKRINEL
jgi:flagellar biogenesis protein FliO